jgi:hypothetical protein
MFSLDKETLQKIPLSWNMLNKQHGQQTIGSLPAQETNYMFRDVTQALGVGKRMRSRLVSLWFGNGLLRTWQ